MKVITCCLALLLLGGATELKIVVPKDETVLTDPDHRYDFVTLARGAESVVRVKEALRSMDDTTAVVTLDVVEQIAGVPVEHLRIAASIWDVVAPWDIRREGTTFLLMIRDRDEILHVHSNGIPFKYGWGIIPIVDGTVPERYSDRYDSLLILRPVTLALIKQQLSRRSTAK